MEFKQYNISHLSVKLVKGFFFHFIFSLLACRSEVGKYGLCNKSGPWFIFVICELRISFIFLRLTKKEYVADAIGQLQSLKYLVFDPLRKIFSLDEEDS